MISMPHLPQMEWDYKDQLRATRRQITTTGRGEKTFYVYNSSGQRVRKVTERSSGSRKEERIYVGHFEIFRKYDSLGAISFERETLHVLDDQQRIALVETKTVDHFDRIEDPTSRTRFQFDNHLGSSVLELDEEASVISYEEYYPYGSTSFEASRTSEEVSRKRYRYIGKERDEENGFYYLGARYYASWLGRWTAPDPRGLVDGSNLYAYGLANPIRLVDPSGTEGKPPVKLNDVVPYGQKIENRASIGHNVQKDHVIAQAKIKDIRTDPNGVVHYDPKKDPSVVVETGKAKGGKPAKPHTQKTFHDPQADVKEIKRLRQEGMKSFTGDIVEPSRQAAIRSGMKPEAVDQAVWGQLDNLHSSQTLEETAAELKRLEAASTPAASTAAKETSTTAAKETATTAAKDTAALAKDTGTATKELVSTGTKELVTVEKTGLKEGAKLVGTKVAKFVPVVGIVVGVGLVANDLRTGDYTAAAWDTAEAIPVVGDVVGAAHLGITVGTLANEGLGIDKVAAEHGEAAEKLARSMGMSKDAAMYVGATEAAISSITIAPTIAIGRKIASWL